MALTFPNASRSYDEAGKRIRFQGYDGMFEVKFFVEVAALSKAITKAVAGEADYLAAFDSVRASVLDVARKAYAHSRSNMYVLTPADFK